MRWFCTCSISQSSGTDILLCWVNPVVELENLCPKLTCAYAVAHVSRRTNCCCPRLDSCGHCQMWPERLRPLWGPAANLPRSLEMVVLIRIRQGLWSNPGNRELFLQAAILTATNKNKGVTCSSDIFELLQNLISCPSWIFAMLRVPAMHRQFKLKWRQDLQKAISISRRLWFWLYLINNNPNNLYQLMSFQLHLHY